MGINFNKIKENWESVKTSSHFRNFLLFLLFLCIAGFFWVISSMNDRVQMNMDVSLSIINKPDSVTFINLPPEKIHVTITDKGTSLFRSSMMRTPILELNFKEFSSNGIFRISNTEFYSLLRNKFGSNAQISTLSVDSLRLVYTTLPPKIVPVDIIADLSAANGYVVIPKLESSAKVVKVYSTSQDILDTINKINTVKLMKSGISQNTTIRTQLHSYKNIRVEPDYTEVGVSVEPLVCKQVQVEIKPMNVPESESMLLFPSMVKLEVFVPMSRFNDKLEDAELQASYFDIKRGRHKLPVKVTHVPSYCVNPSVIPDSVEYTIIR